jgi:hypothetical protein
MPAEIKEEKHYSVYDSDGVLQHAGTDKAKAEEIRDALEAQENEAAEEPDEQ